MDTTGPPPPAPSVVEMKHVDDTATLMETENGAVVDHTMVSPTGPVQPIVPGGASSEHGPMVGEMVHPSLSGTHHAHQQQQQQQHHHQQPTMSSVLVDINEFAEDLDLRLGRANGNIYHRKQGVPGVHDGQIMVRLKKKRFIVIDYGVIPTESDMQAAALDAHISTPDGCGRQKCITNECTKVGVPVLLYDSEPNEPPSLYMRSGLCFTCQRNLNEKRRTQRKRKSDVVEPPPAPTVTQTGYHYGGPKKFKLDGDVMDLSSDAIIINGPVGGVKVHGEGYSFQEIASDLQRIVREATHDTDRLVSTVSASTTDNSSAVAFAAAAAAAAAVAAGTDSGGDVTEAVVSAANAAVDASTTNLLHSAGHPQATAGPESDAVGGVGAGPTGPMTSVTEDVSTLYDKAFMSMSKAIFLLSQWKASWDSAVAAATVAQETVNDPGLADAVASAAAVAASTSGPNTANGGDIGQDQNPTTMIPLLLAAEAKNDDEIHLDVKKGGSTDHHSGVVGGTVLGPSVVAVSQIHGGPMDSPKASDTGDMNVFGVEEHQV